MAWNLFTYIFSRKLILILPVCVGLVVFSQSRACAAVSVQILEYPSELKILSEFKLVASVSGLEANKSFNYKVGVGNTTSYFGYGEIKNGDKWVGYNDTDSCNQAPSGTADEADIGEER